MESKIVQYKGDYYDNYAMQRAEMVLGGWAVIDTCIIVYEKHNIKYVRGTITYKK